MAMVGILKTNSCKLRKTADIKSLRYRLLDDNIFCWLENAKRFMLSRYKKNDNNIKKNQIFLADLRLFHADKPNSLAKKHLLEKW